MPSTKLSCGPKTSVYGPTFRDTRAQILAFSGMKPAALDDAAFDLQVQHSLFAAQIHGPQPVDEFASFRAMFEFWPLPWKPEPDSALAGLTVAQFFFAWAWALSEWAKNLLDGVAVADGMAPDEALATGLRAAVSTAQSLLHAKSLLGSVQNGLAQKPSDED
jgi:hypothetical protein